MCLYPKLIKNKKFEPNQKNGGRVPPIVDNRTLYVPVGCGKCMECMKKKAREWQIRLAEEIRENKNGVFVTMTFSEESLQELTPLAEKDIEEMEPKVAKNKIVENEIARIAVRRFLERWRKKYKKSVRHWLVTELGHEGTERIHLHGIIFTENREDIELMWQYGWVYLGEYVNEKTINYIVKYIHKIDEDHKGYQPKVLCSKGIGGNYTNRWDSNVNKYKQGETKETYKFRNGLKSSLPIYYRNKIYSEEEREKLWIEKLDKEERWVGGEKISIKDNERNYYATLMYYRRKNRELGYGDDSPYWSIDEYKKKREELKKLKEFGNTK